MSVLFLPLSIYPARRIVYNLITSEVISLWTLGRSLAAAPLTSSSSRGLIYYTIVVNQDLLSSQVQ